LGIGLFGKQKEKSQEERGKTKKDSVRLNIKFAAEEPRPEAVDSAKYKLLT
jgi:hypothetical protein